MSEVKMSDVKMSEVKMSEEKMSEVKMSEVKMSEVKISAVKMSFWAVLGVGARDILSGSVHYHLNHAGPPNPESTPTYTPSRSPSCKLWQNQGE